MESTRPRPDKQRATLALLGLLCAIVGISYVPFLTSPFVFDSVERLRQPQMQVIQPPWVAATASSRSLVNLTFALNYHAGGLAPWHYRAVNIAIHIANAVLLFWLVRATLRLKGLPLILQTSATGLAFAVALIWAMHPLQTQAVTYVVQRYESLMALMFIAVMYLFLRGTQSSAQFPWYIAAIVVCFVGMAAKPVMVAAAPVVLLFDYTFVAPDWKQLLRRRWWVHALLLSASLWGVFLVRGALQPSKEVSAIGLGLSVVTPWEYFCTQPQVILHYLRLSFWPDMLNLDYMWPVETSTLWITVPGIVLLIILIASLVGVVRKSRWAFLILSVFLILAPTSSIVPIRDLAVEHRMYLPLAFIVAGIVAFGYLGIERLRLAREFKSGLAIGLVAVVTVSLFVRTFLRNRDYADPEQLWTKSLASAPHNFRAHHLLGDIWRERGNLTKAAEHYRQATQLGPTYAPGFQQYAQLLAANGETNRADEYYRRAVEIRPDYALAYDNWGNMYAREGDFEKAMEKYAQAIETNDNFASAHMHIGLVKQQQGDRRAAFESLNKALHIDDGLTVAKFRLAEILASAPEPDLRDGDRAVALAVDLADATNRQDPAILDVLAMAYAENGQFEKAAETARNAHQLALAIEDRKLVEAIARRRELYRDQKPYRMPQREN